MNIYRLDEMATKGSDSSKYQSTTCSLLDLSSLAITTSVIVPTPYSCHSNLRQAVLPAAKGRLGSGWVNILRIWQLLYAPKLSPQTLKMSHSQCSQLSFAPVAHPLFHHAASKRIV
jgi:hypothetical protein